MIVKEFSHLFTSLGHVRVRHIRHPRARELSVYGLCETMD